MSLIKKYTLFTAFVLIIILTLPVHADRFYDWFDYDNDADLNNAWFKSVVTSNLTMGYKGPSYHSSYATLDNIGSGILKTVSIFHEVTMPLLNSTLKTVVSTLLSPLFFASVEFILIKDPGVGAAYYNSTTSWNIDNTTKTQISLLDIQATDFAHTENNSTPDLSTITHVGLRYSVFQPQAGQGLNIWSYSLTPEPETYLMAGAALVLLMLMGF